MDVIQIVLLAVVTFIFAIDQYSLTELVYRPIIACPIIGLIMGDVNIGLEIGGTYELMMVGNMPVGGAQPPNAVLGGIVAVLFAVKAGFDTQAALGASVVFALFGQYVVTLTFSFMAFLMATADKAAAEAKPSGIVKVNFISMAILGSLFAVLAVVAYVGLDTVAGPLEQFSKDFSWVMGGLSAAGGMMRYVGFAILLKIMLANDMWGIYFAGFAAAALLGNVSATSGATLLLVAFIGVAIAMYDFNTNVKLSNAGGNGGQGDGI